MTFIVHKHIRIVKDMCLWKKYVMEILRITDHTNINI